MPTTDPRLAICRQTIVPMLLAATALAAALLTGCGHRAPAAAAAAAPAIAAARLPAGGEAAANAATDWALVPLTDDDVTLYLDVMRAAAERVRHPTTTDLAAMQLEKSAEEKVRQGHPEAITQEEIDSSDTTTMLQSHVDELVAAYRHIDADRYRHIVDRVEDAVVPPPFDFTADGDPDDAGKGYAPDAHDRAAAAAHDANVKLLAPARDEIRRLETVVRDVRPRN